MATSLLLSAGFQGMLNQMAGMGLLEMLTVKARAPLIDPVTQKPVGRPMRAVGAILAWVPGGGGSDAVAQEGQRVTATQEAYYLFSAATAALINDTNYNSVVVVRGNGDPTEWRVRNYTCVGSLYVQLDLEAGGLADQAGNVR